MTDIRQNPQLDLLSRITNLTVPGRDCDSYLASLCDLLSGTLSPSRPVSVRIVLDGRFHECSGFSQEGRGSSFSLDLPDGSSGRLEIFDHDGGLLIDEGAYSALLVQVITGCIAARRLDRLHHDNRERMKELRGIRQTASILKEDRPLSESLEKISLLLPEAWQYPEDTAVRICLDGVCYESGGFEESPWSMEQDFEMPDGKQGSIVVYYLREYPEADEGPFLKEERELLINLGRLISGSAGSRAFRRLMNEHGERLKELRAINRTSLLISECRSMDETLSEIAAVLKESWQYPEYAEALIRFEGRDYGSPGYRESLWKQQENFVTIDNKKGFIKLVYLKELPPAEEGPFLREERELLGNIAKLVEAFLNDFKGRDFYRKNAHKGYRIEARGDYQKSLVTNKGPLKLFFNQRVLDKYIYLDMMRYKVKEILFVATLYDAFILGNEDGFFERFMGEIYQYSLFSLPRITGVTTEEEALEMLEAKSFDLVILMVGLDDQAPSQLSALIKEKRPAMPVYLLLNQKDKLRHYEQLVASSRTLDNIFFWNGDSQILFSIVKSIEDKANVSNDTEVGLVRVILLVEDSCLYYSRYLQLLYEIVFEQVQQLLPEVEKNELDKICKMRSRPKILLARNYEDAMHLYNKYRDYLLCVISDIEFEHQGTADKRAGLKFTRYIRSHMMNLPVILQSSDEGSRGQAEELEALFLNKSSPTLSKDLKKYLTYYLGFGDFIFRDREGHQIAVAKSLREFEELLETVPDETVYLHAVENQFSIWLMARGEINLAKTLNPMKISRVEEVPELRRRTLDTIRGYREDKRLGKVMRFEQGMEIDEKNILTLADGSLGGKGRGLAFINALIYNFDASAVSNRINIRTPRTVIIGTAEYDEFIHENRLYDRCRERDFESLKKRFVSCRLSDELVKKLKIFLDQVDRPVAVRSSSLSEDSFTQPFAGVFHTYIIPQSSEGKKRTLEKLRQSVKLVFASIFSEEAREYFRAIHHRVEDEKMAVVLQELVGENYGDYYYPHVSGVACSYNYYPVAHMKPEEGFAMLALGLGSYVVEGMSSYRFSPSYPRVQMYAPRDLVGNSQVKFYALNCRRDDMDYTVDGELASLELLDIAEAEKHGALLPCVSVYDPQNDRMVPGLSAAGPRVVNFAHILQYDSVPLAKTLEILLATVKEALGSPVEIEFAVDLKPAENGLPTFYLLQIKPMVESRGGGTSLEGVRKEEALLYTETSLGNGLVDSIRDVIYVDRGAFDKTRTREMAAEIEYLNSLMEGRPYILIGPGRWGTRDRFLGIPVTWAQISGARIIVEMSLDNFPLDFSLGSHFFHNVTSMNIGYFSVNAGAGRDFIDWERLSSQPVIHETEFFRHVRFERPLKVMMDGREKRSCIMEEGL